jgi:hypothetical protein
MEVEIMAKKVFQDPRVPSSAIDPPARLRGRTPPGVSHGRPACSSCGRTDFLRPFYRGEELVCPRCFFSLVESGAIVLAVAS